MQLIQFDMYHHLHIFMLSYITITITCLLYRKCVKI